MTWLAGLAVGIGLIAAGLDVVPATVLGAAVALVLERVAWLERRVRHLEADARQHGAHHEILDLARPAVAEPPPPVAAVPPPAPPYTGPEPWQPPDVAAPYASAATEAPAASSSQPAWRLPALGDLERLLAGRALAIVGGLALVIGVVFFLGLAFSRGWIGPEARVVVGLVAGGGSIALGGWMFGGRQRVVGHVLVAVGLATVSLALFAGTRLYDLVSPDIGLLGSLAAAVAAAAIAARAGSQLVAAYGLVAVLAAPPIMAAEPTLLTMAFLGTALVGTTALAIARDWRWLPPVAFIVASPQLASYIVDTPPLATALVALGAFWLLNVLAASGEEVRRQRMEPSPSSATLLLATAAFGVWAGFELLDGNLEPWRGPFLLAVAVAHLSLGAVFVAREHDRHAFALLAVGTGVAALTMAVPIQLGGPPVPIAWAAEAAALAWVAGERRHGYSAMAAVALGALAVGHLLVIEYPLLDYQFGPPVFTQPPDLPFVSGRGGALGFVLAAMAVAGWLSRIRIARLVLAAAGVMLLSYAIVYELVPLAAVAAWTGLGSATIVVMRRVLATPLQAPDDASESQVELRAPYVAAGFAGLLAIGTTLDELLPLRQLAGRLAPSADAVLGLDAGTVAGMILVAGAAGAGLATGSASWRGWGLVLAATGAAYLLPFDLPPAWTIVGWAAIGSVLVAVSVVDALPLYRRAALALGVLGTVLALAAVMPHERLVLDGTSSAIVPFANTGSLGLVALIGLAVLAWLAEPDEPESRAALAIGGAIGVYLLSIGTVDAFRAQLGGGLALEELQKQAQLALSILWALLGGSGLAIGLNRRWLPVRVFGFGLLGLATVKVFLLDLATLDVAYRVLAFIGLGLLLLASAWIIFRVQPSADGRSKPSPD